MASLTFRLLDVVVASLRWSRLHVQQLKLKPMEGLLLLAALTLAAAHLSLPLLLRRLSLAR